MNPDNSSRIGEPNSPELLAGADGRGRWQAFGFDTNRIVWSPDVDVNRGRQLGGLILQRWLNYGDKFGLPNFERGRLGYPVTAEEQAQGGRYNNFQGGAITYQYGALAAYPTWGDIRNSWAQSGYETGQYGFPSSEEMRCAQQPASDGTFGASGQLFSNNTRYINSGVATSFGSIAGSGFDAVNQSTVPPQLNIGGTTKYESNVTSAITQWNTTSNGLGKVRLTRVAADSPLANVTVGDVNIPNGYRGQYNSFLRTIRYNDATITTGSSPAARQQHTVTHEIGHSLGLRHSCDLGLMSPVNNTIQIPNPLDRIVYKEIWGLF